MAEQKVSPWIRGIVDTLVGAAILRKSRIPHRNRLAVILIDSAFETACRAFLQNKARVQLQEGHRHRENLVSTVKAKLPQIDSEVWDNINYFYTEIRCDFYHQSAGKTITDVTFLDYQDTVYFVLNQAFGLQIEELVSSELSRLATEEAEATPQAPSKIQLSEVNGKVNKVLVAVALLEPDGVDKVNDFFKKEGEPLRLKSDEFTGIVARNSGSRKFFYHDKDSRKWRLSALGRFKLSQIEPGGGNGQ